MAKKKNNRRRGFSYQTLFKVIRLISLGVPAGYIIATSGITMSALEQIMQRYFAFDPRTRKFTLQYIPEGYGPFLATSVITWGIPKLIGFMRRF